MLATEYAKFYNIEAQREGESDLPFRSRVAGALRDMGKIIEAHEAQADERYETSDDVMTGIVGAIAQVYHGIDYGVSGKSQIGTDIAAGVLTRNPAPETSVEMILLACLLDEAKRR